MGHPGYAEGVFCSSARVLMSGGIFAGLALALGGGHFTIAALAALPYAMRLSHLAVPALLRRAGSGRVARAATWMERTGFLVAVTVAVVRPGRWTLPGFLAGFALGVLGQQLYDGSLASLHSEATTPEQFGQYTAIKSRWSSLAGLVLGVLASLALDRTERLGVPAHIARSMAIAGGVAVHLMLSIPISRLRARARALAPHHVATQPSGCGLPTPTTPQGIVDEGRRWLMWPRTREQWALVRFACAWGFAIGFSTRQGEAMALSKLGVSMGDIMLLGALAVGGGMLGARAWGRLGDRFGGKGLMSIALAGLSLDPLWWLAALYVHPAFLVVGYLSYGVCNNGWNIAVSMTLVRTMGSAAERIRAFAVYSVAFGLAAGAAPLLSGALLDLLDARLGSANAYGAIFGIGLLLRVTAYPWLRRMPAPRAEQGRYVSAVVLRAMRWRVGRRWRQSPIAAIERQPDQAMVSSP